MESTYMSLIIVNQINLLHTSSTVYVVVSFIVMLLVYIYLPQRRKRTLARKRITKDNNDDPMNIQMVDLMDKAASSNVNTNVDQKISSFDFHQAEEDSEDD